MAALEVDINLEDDTAEERIEANYAEFHAACDMAGRRDAASLIKGFDGNNQVMREISGTISADG